MRADKSNGSEQSADSSSSRRVQQLRETVDRLRAKLKEEADKRQINERLTAEARKAQAKMINEVGVLREQGRKLADQVQKLVQNSERRDTTRREALAKVTELKETLRRKNDELKRKSTELARLAKQSGQRARKILRSRP